ncbi:MAG: helix-turn-helix transcriptional regulator [Candidatus Latescibacterota bacterium]|nr:MAG: helix-turn-helix transcriptional regulator [Candidatus Latescibacterota bacterium]
MPSKQKLGARIKRFRLERNLTLKEVELKANVSATHVSEIERGMTSPTVGALAKIARALGTEPSYFLQNSAYPAVSVVRSSDRQVFSFDSWGAKINRLNDGIRDSRMSFLEVELEPGLAQNVEPLSHTGEEFVHILRGVVEINVGDSRQLLKEGDSIHFKSKEPHTIKNIGDGHSRLLWVVSPPYQL